MSLYGRNSDWSRLYPLLRLLSIGKVIYQADETPYLIKRITRNDESGEISYFIQDGTIRVVSKDGEIMIGRERCEQAANSILPLSKQPDGERIEAPDYEFLFDQLGFTWFQPAGESPADFTVVLEGKENDNEIVIPAIVKSCGARYYLLFPTRMGNIKYDILNVKLANPESNKINGFEGERALTMRLNEIERLGGKLKYSSPESKFFLDNLSLIDLHMPRLYAELIKSYYTTYDTKLPTLVEEIKLNNPYKIKDELIQKYNFYEYKIKQLLFAFDSGMKPSKIYHGYAPNAFGRLITNRKGELRLIDSRDRLFYEEFLYQNCKLGEVDCDAHKLGYIEKENSQWLFKLNCSFYI